MSRKDYELIAKGLARKRSELSSLDKIAGFVLAVNSIADSFAIDNRNFNRARFMQAVNPDGRSGSV